jgi:uncharacterized protein
MVFAEAIGCRICRNTEVPMADGVCLATTVVLPPGNGPFPVVLVRTAYSRVAMASHDWARRGMALVVQDCRGRYDSGGEHVPFVNEGADGRDTLEWIHAQPWCNGKVGMFGDSYLAATQFYAVREAGHLLHCVNPRFMAGDCWQRAYYCGGAFSLALTWSWLSFECAARTSEAVQMPLLDVAGVLRQLPILHLDERGGGGLCPHYREYVRRNRYDDYWKTLSIRDDYARYTMPVLLTAGWYDNYPAEAVTNYLGLLEHAPTPELRASHRLLIGPWTHGVNSSSALGQIDFGQEARREDNATVRWLEATLCGDGPAAFQKAPIRLFVMGVNQWRDVDQWPLPGTRFTPFYLRSGGGANTAAGDGRLSLEAPQSEAPDCFTYDPHDPVPTLGGNHSVGPYNPGLYDLARPGPYDQAPVESRHDVLVYTSDPLTRDIEVTGPVRLKLFAASSARDTDFVARLVDVCPDGRAMNITEGVIRARFRHSVHAEPVLLEPGRVTAFDIDLQVTSNVFLCGHRIRIDITSSSFPLWDRNLNTGNDPALDTQPAVAEQTVHHTGEFASHALLPIVPAS